MTRAIFHPAARRELEETIDRYNTEREGLGREFREEVQRVLDLLARFPRLGQPVRGSVRRAMLSRFPYHMYYRLLESGDLRILALGPRPGQRPPTRGSCMRRRRPDRPDKGQGL